MIKFFNKDHLLPGFIAGITLISVLYFFLIGIDKIFEYYFSRPLFIKEDAKQLIILATIIVWFRKHIKGGTIGFGSGVFMALFFGTLMYLFQKKTTFAIW